MLTAPFTLLLTSLLSLSLIVPTSAISENLQESSIHSSESYVRPFYVDQNQQEARLLNAQVEVSYQFRDATTADLDDINTVVIDAFSPGAMWQYTRPEWGAHKRQTWYCMRRELGLAWEQSRQVRESGEAQVKVISVPVAHRGDGTGTRRDERVVAVGVWLLMNETEHEEGVEGEDILGLRRGRGRGRGRGLGPGPGLGAWRRWSTPSQFIHSAEFNDDAEPNQLSSSSPTPLPYESKYKCSTRHRHDFNATRSNDCDRQFDIVEEKYLSKPFGRQLYLSVLATHPDWDGHGFAAVNCHWGMRLARELNLPVTLMATPAGFPLYQDLGFDALHNFTFRTFDGYPTTDLWVEAMKYDSWN